MDSSPSGSSGILQARIPEWVAILFSRRSFQPRDRTRVSPIAGRLFTIWATRAYPCLNKLSLHLGRPRWCRGVGWEDSLENRMTNHSSILAWRIPGTEEPGRLQSMGLQKSQTWFSLWASPYYFLNLSASALNVFLTKKEPQIHQQHFTAVLSGLPWPNHVLKVPIIKPHSFHPCLLHTSCAPRIVLGPVDPKVIK